MPSFRHASLALVALTAVFLQPDKARAARSEGVSMEIIVDGRPLRELVGERGLYVEARKSRNYSIRLRNDTRGRVAVALAVDGLNSIDAKHTSASEAAKWVLSPYETVEIEGWQVDDGHARRFVFTTEEKSYGAWSGDRRNLGMISAVFFKEEARELCAVSPEPHDDHDHRNGQTWAEGEKARPHGTRRGGAEAKERSRSPSSKVSPDQDPSEASAESVGSPPALSGRGASVAPRPPKAKEGYAATGMGGETRHEVEWTAFELASHPIASFHVRYAYRDELTALGIDLDQSPVPSAIRRRERAAGFAPDPGLACCR